MSAYRSLTKSQKKKLLKALVSALKKELANRKKN